MTRGKGPRRPKPKTKASKARKSGRPRRKAKQRGKYYDKPLLPFRMRLWIKQNYRCGICNKQIRQWNLYDDNINLDHIVAKSKGGTRDLDNMAVVHMACNQAKADDCPCDWYGPEFCTTDIHGGDGDKRWRR